MDQTHRWIALVALPLLLGATAGGGQMKLMYEPTQGGAIELRRVPVIRGSSIQLYAPGWTRGFYSSNGEPARVERVNERSVLVHHRGRKAAAVIEERYEFVADNRLAITLSGKLDGPGQDEARLEWAIGYLNAFALYGGSVSSLDGRQRTVIVPEPQRDALTPDRSRYNAGDGGGCPPAGIFFSHTCAEAKGRDSTCVN